MSELATLIRAAVSDLRDPITLIELVSIPAAISGMIFILLVAIWG